MAICRTCGTHIGWRFESRSWNKSGGRGDASLFWGLIWRHLREHCAAGPQPQTSKRPELRCPKEHPLRRYATPHAHYICDVCNRQVKVGEHLWGCGACDYDMCDGCKAKVIHGAKVEHRESQGLAGLAKTAQKPSQEAPPEAQQALPAIALPLRPEVALWRCHAMYWP
ncbi:NmrA-like family domain-containing protein 1 [Durusdinium trenchii]